MLDTFLELFTKETTSTIEGLTGKSAYFGPYTQYSASEFSAISAPALVLSFSTSSGSGAIIAAPALMSAISEWMIGEEEISGNTELGSDEIDASKEALSNVLSALSTTLGAQKILPALSFKITDCEFFSEQLSLSGLKDIYCYDVSISGVEEKLAIAFDKKLGKKLGAKEEEEEEVEAQAPAAQVITAPSKEYKNIDLIMDVRLSVRVRIGSKKMLLRDITGMDIGSVIELEQLANDPLDILVGDKKVAVGEVVIVDGNFGIQITEIGSKKERLESLR